MKSVGGRFTSVKEGNKRVKVFFRRENGVSRRFDGFGWWEWPAHGLFLRHSIDMYFFCTLKRMKNKMNKRWISGWLLVGQLLLFACYDETNTYGDNLVESAFRNVMVDTCTVTVTSTVIDSLETTGQGVLYWCR